MDREAVRVTSSLHLYPTEPLTSGQIQPLRILKGSSNSPSKMPGSNSRPLSENPMGIRRNSGNLNSATPQFHNHDAKHDSSPFDPSPSGNSTLAFWKSKESLSPGNIGNENAPFRQPSPSQERRSSLENLKKASRVHNNIFARDYDHEGQSYPIPPPEGQLCRGRPLGARPENGGNGGNNSPQTLPFRGTEELVTKIPWLGRTNPPKWSPSRPISTTKVSYSPPKSSLSTNSRYAAATQFADAVTPSVDDENSEILSQAATPRPIIRHPKSVSFDIAPPQINEYEEITPDPSSVASGSREGSYDSDTYDLDDGFENHQQPDGENSFDESLEDLDQTPVVMPEDWRFMSPGLANTDLAETFDDPFDGQSTRQTPINRRSSSAGSINPITRSDSVKSSGEHRPLPPLPAVSGNSADVSRLTLNAGATPKASHISSIASNPASNLNIGGRIARDSPMPWEDRLRLLSLHNRSTEALPNLSTTPEERPKASDVRLAYQNDSKVQIKVEPEEETATQKFQPPSRISRESILRKVRSKQSSFDGGYDDYSFADEDEDFVEKNNGEETDYQYANLDPDVPIPSREKSETYEGMQTICQNETDDQEDQYQYEDDLDRNDEGDEADDSTSQSVEETRRTSALHRKLTMSDIREEYQSTTEKKEISAIHNEKPSEVSTDSPFLAITQTTTSTTMTFTTLLSTPTMSQSSDQLKSGLDPKLTSHTDDSMTLPEISSFMSNNDFGLGLESYLLPSPPEEHQWATMDREPTKQSRKTSPDRPLTPVEQIASAYSPEIYYDEEEDGVKTPDSVIHHSVESTSQQEESPAVPELLATIKAPGAKLKTRPSATPADIHAMVAARRLVSDEKPLPRLPDEDEDSDGNFEGLCGVEESEEESNKMTKPGNGVVHRITSLQVKLDVPLEHDTVENGFGLEKEFDKVIAAQKRGYIMRENAKVVVASNRKVSDDSTSVESDQTEIQPSPTRRTKETRRPSQQTWKAEPWNGRARRQSARVSTIVPEKGIKLGEENAVAEGLDTLAEDEASPQDNDPDGGERGRLFVKVVCVKELELPLPKDERCHFQLTLDNGLHCVTTNWAELGRTAPVGQEFELVVFDDLEFQLTLQTQLQRPKSPSPSLDLSTTPSTKTTKVSKIKNLLRSPQKRRELEQKQRDDEEAYAAQQKQREVEYQRLSHRPTAWDLQHEIVGADGSFARAYVSLNSYEKQAFGRPRNFDIPCFNEWAVEDRSITSSTRSKLGGMQRRPPYKIGKIELQLLYIPKPRGVSEEDMPRSITAAIKQLKEAEVEATVDHQFAGFLSQEGGDCPFWRRRFFKLQGTKLTAYHESTRQLRATINLAKATQLIDDRSSLTRTPEQSTSSTKGKGRRKSAFAQDEEGYMFVEEGFRIRFANGESIDFYADSPQQKEHWMTVLKEVVGKNGATGKVSWTDAVFARERAQKAQAALEKPNMLKEEKLPLRGATKAVGAPSPIRKPVGGGTGASTGLDGGSLPVNGRENAPRSTQQSPQKHWSMPAPGRQQESPAKRQERRQKDVRSMMY